MHKRQQRCVCPNLFLMLILLSQQTFASEGLQYSMGGLTGNTRNSHRLLAWAAAEHGLDKQNQLAELLFNGYFCKVCLCERNQGSCAPV